ncbi:MAG: hypothetical protein JOS17DRAFT_816495 [Linnemannia elongata]|nr:MAG: hypothetical protein JOS17DRAFT_816495 [Linnemannia elongata]
MHHDPTSASTTSTSTSSASPATSDLGLLNNLDLCKPLFFSPPLPLSPVSVSTSGVSSVGSPFSTPQFILCSSARHHSRRGTLGALTVSVPCLTSSHIRPNINRHADVLAIHQSFDLSKPFEPSSSSPPPSPTTSTVTSQSSTHNQLSPLVDSQPERSISLSRLLTASVQEQPLSSRDQPQPQEKRQPQSGSPSSPSLSSLSRQEKFDNNNKNNNKTNNHLNDNNNNSICGGNGLGLQMIVSQDHAVAMGHVVDQDSVLLSPEADIQAYNSSRDEHRRCKRRKSSSSRSSRHQMLSNDSSSSSRSRSRHSRSRRHDKHWISNSDSGADNRGGWKSTQITIEHIHDSEEGCVEQGNVFSSAFDPSTVITTTFDTDGLAG